MYRIAAPIQLLSGKGYGVEDLVLFREGKTAGLRTVYVNGKPVKRAIEKLEIRACVQPVDGKELLLVPEGDRKKEQFWVWIEEQCFHEGTLEVNDKIARNGHLYQVQQTQQWLGYVEGRMMKIDVGIQEREAAE